MRVDLLKKLAKRLEKIAATPRKERARKFDMGVWFLQEPKCHTAACAAGEACLLPSFKREGLELSSIGCSPGYMNPCVSTPDGLKLGSEALAHVLKIDVEKARTLFNPAFYSGPVERITPKKVAKRIRRLIEARS